MKATLISLILLSCLSSHAASLCLDLFQPTNSPQFEKTISRIENLNPDILEELGVRSESLTAWKTIYLALKTEGWNWLPLGQLPWKNHETIPPEWIDRWIHNAPPRFELDNLTEKEWRIFYVNNLQGEYQAVLRHLIRFYLHQQLPELSHNLESQLFEVLSASQPTDFNNSDLDPARAAEYLRTWPEEIALERYAAVLTELNGKLVDPEQLESLASWALLSQQEQQLMKRAFRQQVQDTLCCRTDTGCLFCPLNLGFLKLPSKK